MEEKLDNKSTNSLSPSVDSTSKPRLPLSKRRMWHVLLASLVFITIIYSAQQAISQHNNLSYKKGQTSMPLSSNKTMPLMKLLSAPTSVPNMKWTLIKEGGDKRELIYKFSEEQPGYIERWKNYLFYSYYQDDGKIKNNEAGIVVYEYNMDTGNSKALFRQKAKGLTMSYLKITEDTLFFSMGAYQAKGQTYWIDLKSNHAPHKLGYDDNGEIEKIKNYYFLTHGWGDSCAASIDYNLIDMRTKNIRHLIKTAIGCAIGEESLGISNNGEMILAQHGDNQKQISAFIYLNVSSISLKEPNQKKYILNSEQMPKNITTLKYSEEENELLLMGEALYLYSFDTNKLEKITNLPKEFIQQYLSPFNLPHIDSWKKNIACIEKTNEEPYSINKLSVNLDTKQSSTDTSACPPKVAEIRRTERTAQVAFKDLNLPPNYKLVQQ